MIAPILIFDRGGSRLWLIIGSRAQSYPAANNADSTSRGAWPQGIFFADAIFPVGGEDGAPAGKFGSRFLRFEVPGRSGMGIHAGRLGKVDKAGREGVYHATMGCIRTTEEALAAIETARELLGLPTLCVPR